MENSMTKHQRFLKQGPQIAEFFAAFGKEPTMTKFRIQGEQALKNILEREGNHDSGCLANRGTLHPNLYSNSGSLLDALVKRIAVNFTGLLAKVDSLQEEIAKRDQRIRELQEKLVAAQSSSLQDEETVLTEVVLLCQKAEEQIKGGGK